LTALKAEYPDVDIKVLVRSDSDVDKLRKAGFTPVQGTLQDGDKIADLSANADVVINAGDSDDVAVTNAILRGLKARRDAGNNAGVLIHTSGIMSFKDDQENGKFDPSAKFWTDDEEDIRSLTPSMRHGPVDISILKAGEEGYVHTYILSPSGVYGAPFGPLAKPLLFHKYFVEPFIQRRQAYYVGEGSNIFETVHIKDLVDLYLRVYNLAIAGPPKTNPYERYYIATSGKHSWKEISSSIAEALYKKGHIDSPDPKSINFQELPGPIGSVVAANVNCRVGRALSLGWVPKERSLLEDMSDFVEDHLAGKA